MVIYIDLLILFNFIINFIFLYVIETIYQEKIAIRKIFLGGVIGGLLVLGFLLDYYLYYFFKIFGGIIVGIIGWQKKGGVKMIVKISSFYVLNFASIGLIGCFQIKTWYWLFLSMGAIMVIYFIESNKKIDIFINQLKYNISVTFFDKKINLEGYLDTGNFSVCDNLPIIYLSNKYFSNYEAYKIVEINTVNGCSKLITYKPHNFIIEIGKHKYQKEVLVVFTDLNEFECLLNNDLFI